MQTLGVRRGLRVPEPVRASPLSPPACLSVFRFHPPPGVAHRLPVGLVLQPARRLRTERALAAGPRPGAPASPPPPPRVREVRVPRRRARSQEPPSRCPSRPGPGSPSTTMAAAWIPALCLGGYAPLAAPSPRRRAQAEPSCRPLFAGVALLLPPEPAGCVGAGEWRVPAGRGLGPGGGRGRGRQVGARPGAARPAAPGGSGRPEHPHSPLEPIHSR